MKVDVYTSTGTKEGTMELPASLFATPVNRGLMHQALVMQQSNRARPIAHAKSRSEVRGSTRKLYQQKGTGRARRGSVRSPLLRGGGKAFGPKKVRNFTKNMPRAMRHAAIRSCLSLQAKEGTIVGLQSYPQEIKTATAVALIAKLPVDRGRRIIFVLPEKHRALSLSLRNIRGAKAILASYLNPEDVLGAHLMVFVHGALGRAEEIFGSPRAGGKEREEIEGIPSSAPAFVRPRRTTAGKGATEGREEIENAKKAKPRTVSKKSAEQKVRKSSKSSQSSLSSEASAKEDASSRPPVASAKGGASS